ncbi:MAG TPA: PP2C family serine/threonine-protein phosphatase [Hydrogenophilus thermoluteolus]|nr:PP2C family serine/threonine-protein phosphatase [Hydrogenophilus thermoluteolus]HNU19361.1 PP2C family serine/threonine-protein phosphatase [Hydrogenophilus thermoluteolus]
MSKKRTGQHGHDYMNRAPSNAQYEPKQKKPNVFSSCDVASASVKQPDAPVQPKGTQRDEENDKSAPPEPGIALDQWRGEAEAVKGLAHHRSRLPCQDAARWRQLPRPLIVVSDGAGSAKVSELGAQALVMGVSTFVATIDDWLSEWLDDTREEAQANTQAQRLSRWLLAFGKETLAQLAEAERRSIADLRATLLLAIAGKRWCFWWQVGDGAVVCRRNGDLQLLTDTARVKGEFANHTTFIDQAQSESVQFGLVPTALVSGIAVMSDGSAERLVAHDGSCVARQLGQWFDDAVAQRLDAMALAKIFRDPAFWHRTSLDDCSIALMARKEA